MKQLESSVERSFVDLVSKMGLLTVKIKKLGWPDRDVILPNGYHFYIEFKRAGEVVDAKPKPRPIQVHIHSMLRTLGVHVYVCHTLQSAKDRLNYELKLSSTALRHNSYTLTNRYEAS